MARDVLGIQIGGGDVGMIRLALQKQPVVVACGRTLVPKDSTLNPEVMVELLESVWKQPEAGVFKISDAYLSVPEQQVFRKVLELPRSLPDTQIMPAILSELENFLPGEASAMQIDYQPVPDSYFAKPSEQTRAVAVVAVEKKYIQDYLAVVGSLKLKIKGIDTRPAAIARALLGPQDSKPAIIVEAGSDSVVIALVQRSIVWATAVARWTADAEMNASTVSDEVVHIAKFYANRTGQSEAVKRVILSGMASDAKFKKALSDEMDGDFTEGKLVVSCPKVCDHGLAAAIGSALYPLYEIMPV